MADEPINQGQWVAGRFQAQLDTRAIEMASQALAATQHLDRRIDDGFTSVARRLDDMVEERREQHKSADEKFTSIARAMWTGATGFILLLLGWVFFLATHQAVPHP